MKEVMFAYDKLGNIQYLSHKAAGHANQDFDRDFTYDGSDNQLKAFTVNSNLFQNKYDANGNLAQEGQSRFYEWTANDKMAVFKNQAGNSTPSVYTNYFYNSQGERIKKHTRKGNKIIVTFYMDGGMFETSYVKPTGGNIDNNRFYNTLKISDNGALIATLRVGKNVDDNTPAIKYTVGDHLNNSTAVLKTTGTLINREEFYPFGETSFGGFQYKRYRYNGKEKDEESGLYEYGQRYYAPWVCRFVSVDPVAEDYPQYTSYNYAGNKPVSKKDLEGLQEEGIRPFAQIQAASKDHATNKWEINFNIFTHPYNFRNRNPRTLALLKSEFRLPKPMPYLEKDIERYKTATQMTGGLSEDAFIAASPIGGTAIFLSGAYFQVKYFQAMRRKEDFQRNYQKVSNKREAANLSISTGIWLLKSVEIAAERNVFDNLGIDTSKQFMIDLTNYGLMVQAKQDELLDEQKYQAQGNYSTSEYQNLLEHAFQELLKDMSKDKIENEAQTATGTLGGVQVYSFNIPATKRAYENKPTQTKNYLPSDN